MPRLTEACRFQAGGRSVAANPWALQVVVVDRELRPLFSHIDDAPWVGPREAGGTGRWAPGSTLARAACGDSIALVRYRTDEREVVADTTWSHPTAMAEAAAQSWLTSWEAPKHRQYPAVNAALGGTTAGIAAWLRDEPFLPAFARGAGGGALGYVGKWVAVHPATGTGLLGRQVTSVGSSITGNTVAGRGSLDRIALSVGPVRAYIGRQVEGVHWKLDGPALGAAVWTAFDGGRLDVKESLSFGTMVFKGDGNHRLPGTISYQPWKSPIDVAEALAHEQAHVLQYDHSYLSLGAPLEDWFSERFPRLGRPLGRLELNLPILAAAAALHQWAWDYPDQPWEREAFLLGWLGRIR